MNAPTSPVLNVPAANPPWISRALGFLANPRGLDDPARLRRAVAGRTVLITGASFGLGEATARRLAAAGAVVLLVARTRDRLESLRDEIRAAGGIAHAYPADLSDIAQVEALARTLLREHGTVDILINNAGKSIRRSLALSLDRFRDFERTNAVNFLGPVRLVLALLPAMQAKGAGHIVNISTIGVRVPPGARWAAYQSSKGAFDTWLRSASLELEDSGITTSTIYMALIYTRMSAPTPIYRVLPGLYPDEAAGLVARALVDKPLEISPPWLAPAELAATVFRRPVRLAMRTLYRLTQDTRSARAVAGETP